MRGMILGLAVGLAVLLTAGEGRADYFDGQSLNETCNDDNYYSEGACDGYILGAYDAGKRASVRTACVPDGVKAGQLTEVVKKWLRGHPAAWHYPATSLVASAVREAFPCR